MLKENLFAAEEREAKLNKMGDILQVLGQQVDFAALASSLDQAPPRPSQAKGGRPPYPTGIMVRILVLQQLHGLGDEQMESQLLGRPSFQRFVGLRYSSQIPGEPLFGLFANAWLRRMPMRRYLTPLSANSTVMATLPAAANWSMPAWCQHPSNV